jgi:hypothetical protein
LALHKAEWSSPLGIRKLRIAAGHFKAKWMRVLSPRCSGNENDQASLLPVTPDRTLLRETSMDEYGVEHRIGGQEVDAVGLGHLVEAFEKDTLMMARAGSRDMIE